MIWVLSVLLLLLDAGLAVPVNGSQVAVTNSSINTLRETVKGLEKSIEVLYSKLKVVQNQLTNGYYPYNCLDALNRGYNVSGVYRILPDSGQPFDVYCDQVTDGGGWTVFQRRQDGSVNFQRNRIEYIRGFGYLTGEHWLGLEKIHRLTKWVDFEPELRVDLMDFDNEVRFEHYNKFYVNGPSSYTLFASDYSGSAGDSLTYHSGRGFSTADYDVDGNSRSSCAITNQGAWWFNSCQHSHLNGVYYYGNSPGSHKGIIWYTWRGTSYSLQRTEMKIRPSRLTWKERANE